MSDLEDKLKQLSFYNPGVTRYLKLSDEDIEQIKQAFIDDGWIPKDVADKSIRVERVYPAFPTVSTKAKVDFPDLMTGQEWYDRFKEEYNKIAVIPYQGNAKQIGLEITERVEKIAKKASGLTHPEEGLSTREARDE